MSRITINLAPADIPKRGSQLELAMAISLLAASGQVFDGGIREHMLLLVSYLWMVRLIHAKVF